MESLQEMMATLPLECVLPLCSSIHCLDFHHFGGKLAVRNVVAAIVNRSSFAFLEPVDNTQDQSLAVWWWCTSRPPWCNLLASVHLLFNMSKKRVACNIGKYSWEVAIQIKSSVHKQFARVSLLRRIHKCCFLF